MSEPGTVEQQPGPEHFAPDYKLTSQELDVEGGRLITAFEDLFRDDPDMERARAEQLSDKSIQDRALMFRKKKAVYRKKSEELKDNSGLVIGQKFNLMRYDEEKSEEDLTIIVSRGSAIKPSIEHRLVFSKLDTPNRDYIPDCGLAVTGAREMLGRVRQDFARPVSV